MFRLFDALKEKDTNISIRFSYEIESREDSRLFGFNSAGTFRPCYCKEDFERTFNLMTQELQPYETRGHKLSNVQIHLTGKLNGNDLMVEFNNLNSFKEFLVEKNLITMSNFKLVN